MTTVTRKMLIDEYIRQLVKHGSRYATVDSLGPFLVRLNNCIDTKYSGHFIPGPAFYVACEVVGLDVPPGMSGEACLETIRKLPKE